MKKANLLLILAIQILFVLPSFSQELFIRDVIAKPSKMVSPNAKSGDTQNDYQQERQIIDDYLKQMKQEQMAEDEFMRLFVNCFPRIIKVFQNEPAQHIAVNCAGCRYSNRVELGYGKATTKRSATNGYRK